MLRPFLVDAGLGLVQIGALLGTVGFAAGLVGAVAGGAAVNRLGRRRALLAFAALQALTVAGYAALSLAAPDPVALYLLCAAEHLASGMATAALFTVMMDWCRPEASATDFTVQASAVVIATGAASAASGIVAARLGYPTHFLLATLLCGGAVAAVAWLFPTPRRRDGRPREERACAPRSMPAPSTP
jgi:predicted MFS family arabinose efflux permease